MAVEVFVGGVGEPADLDRHLRELARLVERGDGVGAPARGREQGAALVVERAEAAVELPAEHLRAARGEVGDLADEVGIDALREVVEVEVDVVRGVVDLAGVVVAQERGVEVVQVGARGDERPAALAHLLAVHGEEAVDEHLARPLVAGGVEHRGPEEAVEADDVLADEVVALRGGVAPRRLEGGAVAAAPVLQGGEVADGSVEPHVEVLAGVAGDLEAEVGGVARDVPRQERLVLAEPLLELVGDVGLRVVGEPRAQILLELRQVEQDVLRLARLERTAAAGGAVRVLEVGGRVGRGAVLARVAVLLLLAAVRAGAFHEAVGEEHPALRAPELGDLLAQERTAPVELGVDVLAERLVLGRVRRVVVVEGDLEVGEVARMARVHLRDEILGRAALLAGADHDRRAVRVVRADVGAVGAAHLLEADPEVRLEILDEVPDVDVTVGVGQGRRDDDLAFVHGIASLCEANGARV